MSKDALKFFQAYINEMISVGGENLPKVISTKSGEKLAKLYKDRGMKIDVESALKQIHVALGARTKIKKIDENTYDIQLKYHHKFCPIGGSFKPSRAPLIQNYVCKPYTFGFLCAIFPQFKFEADIENCIVFSNQNMCHYILKLEKRKNL